MKIITIAVLVFYCNSLLAQNELPTKNGIVIYEIIDSSITASKSQLYDRARIWFANAFKDSKEVIQLDDRESGSIIGKGLFKFMPGLTPYICKFSARVDCKDNKYRFQVYDIVIESATTIKSEQPAEFYNSKKGSKKMKEMINERILEMVEGLKKKMAAPSVDAF
jgi:hypothetical protein